MSIQAIAWVFSKEVRPSQAKFVLVALANYCNENCLAWPCVQTICDITSQDDKTVRRALKQLEALGHIKDTGDRVGERKQIKVYKIRLPDAVFLKIPKYGHLKKSKVPKNGVEGTRLRPRRYPDTGRGTINEPLLTNSEKQRTANAVPISEHLAKLKAATNR
jgi:pyocin large subunit-like protein